MQYDDLEKLFRDVRQQAWQRPDSLKTLDPVLIALVEEVGEVCGEVKRFHRDGKPLEDIKYELGDVLWYFVALCDVLGCSLDDVARLNQEKLEARRAAKDAKDAKEPKTLEQRLRGK